MVNIVIERLLDFLHPAHHEEVRVIKDLMAAIVLIASFGAAIIGLMIFWPYIFNYTPNNFLAFLVVCSATSSKLTPFNSAILWATYFTYAGSFLFLDAEQARHTDSRFLQEFFPTEYFFTTSLYELALARRRGGKVITPEKEI